MKTGTDQSIAECRESGYPVVKHGKSKLNPEKEYLLTISNERYWPYGKNKIGTPIDKLYHVHTFISYVALWESFLKAGNGIQSYCDFANCPLPAPNESPDYSDFVTLAGIVHSYCGL